MSLEGRIRDLGLQEIGQLLSLGRKTGLLTVSSVLRGSSAWIRFADGAMVDASLGESDGESEARSATAAAMRGAREEVESVILEVLAWREGRFIFAPEPRNLQLKSKVRIPTDAMLVESARRDDAWRQIRDRVPHADGIPSFVDVEPKSLPLLRLVPQEWEVLTRVDGQRTLRTLSQLLQRDVLEVAAIVHGLVGTGLLVIRDGVKLHRAAISESSTADSAADAQLPPARINGEVVAHDADEIWIPAVAEMAVSGSDPDVDDVVFDPLRAGLLTPHGTPRVIAETSGHRNPDPEGAVTVTFPAQTRVASGVSEQSFNKGPVHVGNLFEAGLKELREQGDEAARRGDFATALERWSQYVSGPDERSDADEVREAIALATRLQALLHPMSIERVTPSHDG